MSEPMEELIARLNDLGIKAALTGMRMPLDADTLDRILAALKAGQRVVDARATYAAMKAERPRPTIVELSAALTDKLDAYEALVRVYREGD